MPARLLSNLILVLLLLGGVAAVLWVRPPRPAGPEAEANAFSAARARAHLDWIAALPRPVGSAAHDAVRERLVKELEALGLPVREEAASVVGSGLALRNLVVRRPGTAGPGAGKTLLLVAHYDSVPRGPGAGDDGAAVAAVLEALRALVLAPPPRNDLVVLLSDGEELGLFGAKAFAQAPGALDDVACILNFEGRGAGGPALLFQLGAGSGGLVRAYAEAAPHPFGSSLGSAVFERLPNDTDFTVFSARGLAGLNFAFIGGGAAYHTAADRVDELDPGSLQHHGETMLALLRSLGEADLEALGAEPAREFFPLPGALAHYPQSLAAPFGLGAALLVALFALRHYVARKPLAFAFGSLASLLLVAAAGAATVLLPRWLDWAVRSIGTRFGFFEEATLGSNVLAGEALTLGAWSCTLGVALLLLRAGLGTREPERFMRRARALGFGSLLFWLLAAALLPLLVPGGGYVGLFGLAGTTLSLLALRTRAPRVGGSAQPEPDEDEKAAPAPDAAAPRFVLGPLPAFFLWSPAALALAPLPPLLVQVGSVDPALETLLAGVATALVLASLVPLLAAVAPRASRWSAPLLLLLAVLLSSLRAALEVGA